jgi:hypothetical protein
MTPRLTRTGVAGKARAKNGATGKASSREEPW